MSTYATDRVPHVAPQLLLWRPLLPQGDDVVPSTVHPRELAPASNLTVVPRRFADSLLPEGLIDYSAMDKPPAAIRKLAERILALEATSMRGTDANESDAVRVCEKLRISLTRIAGADGFSALMRRALALARTETPLLDSVHVSVDGFLIGFEECAGDAIHRGGEPATAIVTQLLGLLVTFVGEGITLRLILDAWPEASSDKLL